MAWDFSTEPEFEEQLVWMREFVRDEIVPLETLDLTHEADGRGGHGPCRSRSGPGTCGPRTFRRSSAAAASARSSSA